jgi:hypothetical protein
LPCPRIGVTDERGTAVPSDGWPLRGRAFGGTFPLTPVASFVRALPRGVAASLLAAPVRAEPLADAPGPRCTAPREVAEPTLPFDPRDAPEPPELTWLPPPPLTCDPPPLDVPPPPDACPPPPPLLPPLDA